MTRFSLLFVCATIVEVWSLRAGINPHTLAGLGATCPRLWPGSSSQMMAGFGAPRAKPKDKFGKKDFERQMRSYNKWYIEGYPPPNQMDVYVHAAGKPKFWFVGKVNARAEAFSEAPDFALAAVVQKRLVLEHAKLLQPLELGRSKALELWCAPPNSEMAVAQKQQALRPLDGLKPGVDGSPALSMADCGFLPEQYTAEDRNGFYVKLPPDGVPEAESKVKIMSPAEAAAGGYLDDQPRPNASPE